MKLAEVSVKRPVFAVMMSAALVVLGWFSYRELGLDLMPRTDSPTVNVRASLPGASAEEIETTITKEIEAAVNTIYSEAQRLRKFVQEFGQATAKSLPDSQAIGPRSVPPVASRTHTMTTSKPPTLGLTPGPPPQCAIPGAMNNRTNALVSR